MQIQLSCNFSGLEISVLKKAGWDLTKTGGYRGEPVPIKDFETIRDAILEVEQVLEIDVLERHVGFLTNHPLPGDVVHSGEDVWYHHSGHEKILPLLYPGTPNNTREAYAKLYSLLPNRTGA